MPSLSGIYTHGSYTSKEVILTGPLSVHGGNWTRVNFKTKPALHPLDFQKDCFIPGVEVDGVPLDLAAIPAHVTVGPGVKLHPEFRRSRMESLPEAVEVLDAVREASGKDGVIAYLRDVQYILDATNDLEYEDWRADRKIWADSTVNTSYSVASFKKMAARLLKKDVKDVSKEDWPDLCNLINEHDMDTWKGKCTKFVNDEPVEA